MCAGKKRRTTSRADDILQESSVFTELVKKHGIILKANNKANEISKFLHLRQQSRIVHSDLTVL